MNVAVIASCSACHAPLENPQRCRACGAFQPHDPRRDHFATLGLAREFALDEALLDRRVVAFSRDLHPDLAGAAPGVRARAVLGAAQVNEAFGVLRDAHKRAEYLLTLLGGAGPNQDKSVPAGFLEAMLDERDAVDAAIAQGGAAAEALRARFEARRLEAEAALARGFAALETAIPEERTTLLASLRRELNGMAYYRTLARDLRDGLRDKESA